MRLGPRGTLAVGAALGFFWYLAHGGAGTLDPRQLGWLQSEDLSQHLLGWLHFRNAPIAFPLGSLPNLAHPVGTTIGFMDSNPWLCLLHRPLSAWLPAQWQFQGLWLASCYAMLSLSGTLLARLYTPRALPQLLVGALIGTAPPALLRVCHENLAAQWLLVFGIYLCLRRAPAGPGEAQEPTSAAARRREARHCVIASVALLTFSLGVHAYLSAMLLPVLWLATVRRWACDRALSGSQAASACMGYVALTALVLWSLGFIGTGIEQSEPGFGAQTADLLALINPVGWSRFLPSYPHTVDQFEGFAYLGLGNLALILVGCTLAVRGRLGGMHKQAWLGLALLAFGYAVFATSDTVWFAGREVLSLRAYTRPILPVLSIFRASGRFLWLAHYALVAFGAAAVLHALPPRAASWVLAGCLALQLADLTPVDVREKLVRRERSPLRSPAWSMMGADYRHLALYPAFFPSNQQDCGWHYPWGYHVPYSFAAYAANMTFNSNYAGRADARRIGAYCRAYVRDVQAGHFAADTVYVVDDAFAQAFVGRPTMLCRGVDGKLLCVDRARQTALQHWLLQQPT